MQYSENQLSCILDIWQTADTWQKDKCKINNELHAVDPKCFGKDSNGCEGMSTGRFVYTAVVVDN